MTRGSIAVLAIVAALVFTVAQSARALDHDRGYGEPYELAGKRLVFTNWMWVRQGQTEWLNAAGKSVFADKSEMAGPFDARFENVDGPWGVRLIAEPAQRGG